MSSPVSKNIFVPVLRKYLRGNMSRQELRWWVIEQVDDVEEEIDAGEDTTLVTHLYWAIRNLTDPIEFRTSDAEIKYLLSCLEGKETFDLEKVNGIYRAFPDDGSEFQIAIQEGANE